MALHYKVLALALYSIAYIESASSVPLKYNQKLESNEIHSEDYYKFFKFEEPEDRIIFDTPQTFGTKTAIPKIESRIQFPEVLPEFQGKSSERWPRQETGSGNASRMSSTPAIVTIHTPTTTEKINSAFEEFLSNYDSSNINLKTTQVKEGERFQYYWLKQWLSNSIVIADDKDLKQKLNEVEKIIEQEFLRSSYQSQSLFRAPNFRKKLSCPQGQRRDHYGRCTTPIILNNRQRV